MAIPSLTEGDITMTRRVMALLITALMLLSSCSGGIFGSDDSTATTTQEQDQDQDQDQHQDQDQDQVRDQDRDRIHQVLATTLTACGEQDRERLRENLQTQLREQVDAAGYRYGNGAMFTLLDEQVTFDGEEAHVRAQIRITEQNGDISDVEVEWRMRGDASGTWQLADVPLCLDTSTTPSTLRDRVQDCDQDCDQDQDRDQDRDQDCDQDCDGDQDRDQDRDRDRDQDG